MSKSNVAKEGLLQLYNLWTLWDEFGDNIQKQIIDYFQSKPLMWDYKDLFIGKKAGSATHGSIDLLTTLLVLEDLKFCDILFNKFKTFNPENYLNGSDWGNNWVNNINHIKRISNGDQLYSSLCISDIYWVDFHFFLITYSKAVYKNFLKGNCSIERFEKSFFLEYQNLDVIQRSIQKLLGGNCRNPIIDQYLIYLEKQKRYEECINLINEFKDLGWTNDFEKRLNRCTSKKNKNGSKS